MVSGKRRTVLKKIKHFTKTCEEFLKLLEVLVPISAKLREICSHWLGFAVGLIAGGFIVYMAATGNNLLPWVSCLLGAGGIATLLRMKKYLDALSK